MSENQKIYRPKKYKPIEYVKHMITCCKEASSFFKDYDKEKYFKPKDFMAETIYFASLSYIQQIGWCAYNLPKSVLHMFPQNDLRRIIAAGYALEHSVFHMEPKIAWSITQDTIPTLLPILKKVKVMIEKGSDQISRKHDILTNVVSA